MKKLPSVHKILIYRIFACLFIGSLAIFPALAQKKKDTFTQEVGLQLYSLRHEFPKDVEGTLAKIKEMGIRQIEGGGTYKLSQEDYKALLDKYGLQMASMGFGYERYNEDIEGVIKDAKAMGAKYVMCAWIPHKGDDFTIEDTKKAAQDFNKWGEKLKANGIQFCYHTHGYEFRPYEDGTLFDYLVKNTNPEYVSYEMDVYWVVHPGQDPLALLKKYPNRFSMMHLKDMKKGVKGDLTGHSPDEWNVPIGTGQIDYKTLLPEAQRLGVKYYFIEDEHPNAIEQIPVSLKYLKSLAK
jgi:sugar phosphate isomerase/epimerase